jgi:hypothetical protein
MSGVRNVEEGNMKKRSENRERETRETPEIEIWILEMGMIDDIVRMAERDLRETILGTHETQEMLYQVEIHETYHHPRLETREMCHHLVEILNLQRTWTPLVEI